MNLSIDEPRRAPGAADAARARLVAPMRAERATGTYRAPRHVVGPLLQSAVT